MANRRNADYRLPLPEYRYEKIRMLRDDFCIELSEDDVEHFYTLKTEAEIDAYAHDILVKNL